MKIVVYHSADAPASHAYLGKILVKGGFLPVHFAGATEDACRREAQKCWDKAAVKQVAQKLGTARALQESLGQLDPVALSEAEPLASDSDVDALQDVLG
jgi:hypothetical protein